MTHNIYRERERVRGVGGLKSAEMFRGFEGLTLLPDSICVL